MTTVQIECRPITAEQTHALRISVLRPGHPPSDVVFPGDDDDTTLHVGTFHDSTLIAIASLYREAREGSDSSTQWRLRGMATEPAARRMGAGAAALDACEQHARESGGTLAWCNARTGAVAFYEAAGWTVMSEEFDIPTVGPHFVMEKPLV